MPFWTRFSLKKSSSKKPAIFRRAESLPTFRRFAARGETVATTGTVFVTGEIRTQAYVDVDTIVRDVVRSIGYDRAKYGFDCDTCGVINAIHSQSPDIAQGVDESWEAQHGEAADKEDETGAGDQGMVFGYACNETSTLMPMPIYLAHRLSERLTEVRKNGTLPFLRPDGKTQVSVRYVDGKPEAVEKVLISTQHDEGVEHDQLEAALIEHVINPVLAAEGLKAANDMDIYVNPTGRFVIGGPMGDTGLTVARLSSIPTAAWAVMVAARSRAKTARRSTAPQHTLRVGSPKTLWRLAWPIAAKCKSPTLLAWLVR